MRQLFFLNCNIKGLLIMGATMMLPVVTNAQITDVPDSVEYIILKSVELDEVAVSHQAPVVRLKSDKVTYQVENDAAAKTLTVLEMLRKVPMVTVDGRNNITVNGSAQFKVYVDGRLNTTITRNPSKMLRNMPANNVRNIEVITNPGAQYDAEGAGGVLCIYTKKGAAKKNLMLEDEEAESGTYGSVHTTAGLKQWGLDASLSGQRKRWSWDINLNGEYMRSADAEMESEMTSNAASGNGIRQWMRQNSLSKMPFTMGELGIGYEIDESQSVHANVSVNWFGMKDSGNPSYQYSGGIWGTGMSFSGKQMMSMNDASIDGSFDYQRTWGNRGRLFINYQINHGLGNNDSENSYEGIDLTKHPEMAMILRNNRTEVREHNTAHNVMTDVTIPMADGHWLNIGTKLTYDLGESDAKEMYPDGGSFAEDEDGSLHYKQHQYIAAIYAEWDGKWGWFGIKPGLRYEHTWQSSRYLKGEGSDFSLDYGAVVPSVSITANAGSCHTFGLNYNMRIRRPRINELDPYVNRADPTQLTYGNPHLDAQHLNHAAFVYTLSITQLALRMGLSHAWSNDGISQYSQMVDDRIHTTYGNVSKNRTTSLNAYASWSISGSTRLTLSGDVAYSDMKSPKIDARNYGWQGNANLGLQQTLPWNIKWTTDLEWMSGRHTLQGHESGMTMLSTTLARSFLRDRLSITLSGMTGLGHGGKMVWESVTRNKDFNNVSRFVDSMQDITLGITYTFGGKHDKQMEMPRTNDFEADGAGKPMMRRRR